MDPVDALTTMGYAWVDAPSDDSSASNSLRHLFASRIYAVDPAALEEVRTGCRPTGSMVGRIAWRVVCTDDSLGYGWSAPYRHSPRRGDAAPAS